MKKAVFLFLIFVLSMSAYAQGVPAGFDMSNYGVRVEPDKRLMVVLATLEMARVKTNAGEDVRSLNPALSPMGQKFRERLDADFAGLPDDLRTKISVFINQHKKRNASATDAEIITPFISMAYALTPAPELADPVVTTDLPGALLDVLDFAPLVREFYRRSGIAAKLDDYVKEYQQASDGALRNSAKEMVNDLLSYLHTRPQTIYAERVKTETQKSGSKRTVLSQVGTRDRERRFFIVPEMLTPAGNINFLNIRDDYYVIVPPDSDLSFSDARRAFLQYVTDALVLSNAKDITTIRPGIKQLLDDRRKINPSVTPDIYLAVSRSLAAAADARQTEYVNLNAAMQNARQKIAALKTDAEKRAVTAELEKFKQSLADETALRLSEDYEKGSVLVFYFAQALKGTEDSGFDISSSLRDIILSFDASKEKNRLDEFAEARKRAVAAREARKKNPPAVFTVAENPVTTRLLDIQKTIDAKNYTQAFTDLKQLLEKNPNEPRIYYNIGRVASLMAGTTDDANAQAQYLLEAKNAYAKVIQTSTAKTDKALLSLAYVALAKIYEFDDNKDYAVKLYDKAISLDDIPGGAFKEAISAKQRLLKNQ